MQYDRRQNILQILAEQQTATIKELAARLYTSEASIRRDLDALESQGYVHRVYGGVVLAKAGNHITPIGLRDADNAAQKNLVAERAAALIRDGATIILDASSTARRILKYLEGRHDLRIFTNNLRIFEEIGGIDAQVWCTGGLYNEKNHAFIGPAAEAFIRSISADLLFFSSEGISEDGDISDVSEEETSLRRAMLSRAKHRYFLCDSSKLGVRRNFVVCNRSDLDGVICNAPLPWEG